MSEAVEDTYKKKNWVIRLVDLLAFYDRTRRRFRESLVGYCLLEARRARQARKSR